MISTWITIQVTPVASQSGNMLLKGDVLNLTNTPALHGLITSQANLPRMIQAGVRCPF